MNDSLITVPGNALTIIKPLVGYSSEITQQIQRFPFEKNVFLMMRFRKANEGLSDFIIETLEAAGLNGVRADHPDWNVTNNVYNPIAVLYCCKYGIALFDEAEEGQAYNPNVIYELGMMHCLERECLILKNDSLPTIPFDLIKDLYMPYKGDLAVRTNVQRWLQRIGPQANPGRLVVSKTTESRLQTAAVAAPKVRTNRVVGSPDDVATADFSWRILSRTGKAWKISWRLKLTNKSQREIAVKIQVLFLDENGFALEDSMSSPSSTLLPGKSQVYKQTATMSPDLASRIQGAMATVSKSGRARLSSSSI
jgi:hypothetical protein